MATIFYVGFMIGLISNFEKVGQRDLNKKFNAQIQRNLGKMLL